MGLQAVDEILVELDEAPFGELVGNELRIFFSNNIVTLAYLVELRGSHALRVVDGVGAHESVPIRAFQFFRVENLKYGMEGVAINLFGDDGGNRADGDGGSLRWWSHNL